MLSNLAISNIRYNNQYNYSKRVNSSSFDKKSIKPDCKNLFMDYLKYSDMVSFAGLNRPGRKGFNLSIKIFRIIHFKGYSR